MNLIGLAEAGDLAGVVRELGALTPEQRASFAAPLEARSEAMAPEGWLRYTTERRAAVSSAELGCRVTRRPLRTGS